MESIERPPAFRSDRERLRAILMVLPAALLILCVVAMLLPTLLFAPLAGHAVGAVPPDAVHVSAAVFPDGPVLVERAITNPRVVRDLWARLTALPSFTGRMGCTLGPPFPINYTLRFTRWGLPVTIAALGFGDCAAPSRWTMNSGGYSYWRLDQTGAATRAILAEAGLPPLPDQR